TLRSHLFAAIDRADRDNGRAANATRPAKVSLCATDRSVNGASLGSAETIPARSSSMTQLRRVAIVGGNRIPFARSNT
ncbi:hypothetical protein KQ879_15290, partial [Listeria monocytogenes]|nr:hypothetical protein [Listeria monocytogenes]